MGDAADNLTEQEEDFYFLHLSGNCRDHCPYCEEEERRKKPPSYDEDLVK